MLTKLYKKEIRPILEPVYQFGILHESLKLDDNAPNDGWVSADNEEETIEKWKEAFYNGGFDSGYHLIVEDRYTLVGKFDV